MNKKIAIAMASNVALALLITTGCRSLTASRTAFGGGKVDPYEFNRPSDNTFIDSDETTVVQVTPIEVAPTPIIEKPVEIATPVQIQQKDTNTSVPPTVQQKSTPYQKYVVPTDYKNPTDGLKPVTQRPERVEVAEVVPTQKKEDKAPTVKDGYFTYVVKSGDCLSVIANNNGVRTKELAEINNLNPNAQIRIGQKLKVPAGRKPFTSSKSSSTATAIETDGSVYVVKSGDCLSVIAQNLGIKTADLMAINNLKNANSIYIGQKLKLPGNVKAPIVKEETTKNEAVKDKKATEKPAPVINSAPVEKDPFNLDQKTEEIIIPVKETASKTKDDAQPIIIPPAPVEAEEADAFDFDIDDVIKNFEEAPAQTATKVIEKFDTIKITDGDTLELIAANYNTTADALRKLNGFDNSKKLKAGEIIKIPSQSIK